MYGPTEPHDKAVEVAHMVAPYVHPMVRVNRAIAAWIAARPQEWVATHNRWSRAVRRQVIKGQCTGPPLMPPPTLTR